MVTAGNISLFRKSYANKKKKLKKVNKKWYDTDCHKLLRDVTTAENAFNRNNTYASLRIHYYKKFKEYKRTVKLKKRNYKHKLTNLLNEAMDKDPQTAWKIIDELKKMLFLQINQNQSIVMNGIIILTNYYIIM